MILTQLFQEVSINCHLTSSYSTEIDPGNRGHGVAIHVAINIDWDRLGKNRPLFSIRPVKTSRNAI